MTTVGEALASARRAFRDAGVASAALDARLLLAAAAGMEAGAVPARRDQPVAPEAASRLRGYIQRRVAGEPVARILGEKEFWGLAFRLNATTLEPRPDTEALVEAALQEARGMGGADLSICDLGTGTGAIIVALLTELPQARGTATDLSPEVLAVARENADMHGVGGRLDLQLGDFATTPAGRFDLVVSNPPYIDTSALSNLPREVRDHDPRLALDGGVDGLAAYRTIVRRGGALLSPGGALLVEIGVGQGDAVSELCGSAGLVVSRRARDLAGVERVIVAQRGPD